MISRNELLSFLSSYSLNELDSNYYRLKILSKNNALNYSKHFLFLLLNNKDSYPIGIIKNTHLVALAIVTFQKEDSDILKKRVGSLDWISIDPTLEVPAKKQIILELLKECQKTLKNKFDLITALIDFDQYNFLEIFQEKGAKIYGGNYSWVCHINKIHESIFSTKSLEMVSFLKSDEIHNLIKCVRESYSTYYSHYHADSKLDNNIITEIYVSYVQKHLNNNGQVAVVKNSNGEIIGFSTINPHNELINYFGKNIAAEIAYSGVIPSARGSKAYELTLIHGIEFFKKQNFSHIIFNCSANNYVVQSIWMKLGDFRPRRFCYRMHWWL